MATAFQLLTARGCFLRASPAYETPSSVKRTARALKLQHTTSSHLMQCQYSRAASQAAFPGLATRGLLAGDLLCVTHPDGCASRFEEAVLVLDDLKLVHLKPPAGRQDRLNKYPPLLRCQSLACAQG